MTLFLDAAPAGPEPGAPPRTLAALRALLADGEPHPLPDRRSLRLALRLALRGECRVYSVYGPLPDRRVWAVATGSPWRYSFAAGCWYRDLRRRP